MKVKLFYVNVWKIKKIRSDYSTASKERQGKEKAEKRFKKILEFLV